jgi:hypothetical protein
VGITQIRGNTTSSRMAKAAVKLDRSIGLPELQADPQGPSPLERPARKQEINGAMSQQRSDHNWGNQCAPQKFLHLVGCREPKLLPAPAGRAKR